MKSILIFVIAAAGFLGQHAAHAWGAEGHQLVGAIADARLNANAKAKVATLLKADDGGEPYMLSTAAAWADCARSVKKDEKDKSKLNYSVNGLYEKACLRFANKNQFVNYVDRNGGACADYKCHTAYHFADIAIQKTAYSEKYVGASDRDIVMTIKAIINYLKMPASSGGYKEGYFDFKDQGEALFLLAHFVGDIHQPLHVGAIYLNDDGTPFDLSDTLKADDAIVIKSATHGGNAIKIAEQNLHAIWDDITPALAATSSVSLLKDYINDVPTSTSGELAEWPSRWASDTLKIAKKAFEEIKFEPKEKPDSKEWRASFNSPYDYILKADAIQRQQIIKAGVRLAELLNAIWPTP